MMKTKSTIKRFALAIHNNFKNIKHSGVLESKMLYGW